MSQVDDDFRMICEVGARCGLRNVDEAFDLVNRNYDAFFLTDEATKRLSDLHAHITKIGSWETELNV